MVRKTVEKLEEQIEEAIAEIIVKMASRSCRFCQIAYHVP
jgi:hypothetical protein